jgi:hypothetical protein
LAGELGWLTQISPPSPIVTSSIFVAYNTEGEEKSFLNVLKITLSLGGSQFECEKDTKRNLKCQQEIGK